MTETAPFNWAKDDTDLLGTLPEQVRDAMLAATRKYLAHSWFADPHSDPFLSAVDITLSSGYTPRSVQYEVDFSITVRVYPSAEEEQWFYGSRLEGIMAAPHPHDTKHNLRVLVEVSDHA